MTLSTLKGAEGKLVSASLVITFRAEVRYVPVSSYALGPGIGEDRNASDAVEKALPQLLSKLEKKAKELKADSVIDVRIEASSVSGNSVLLLAYGTAV